MRVGKGACFFRIILNTLGINSIALLFCPALFATSTTEPPLQKVYNSTSYYEEDGLASNMVYEMAQTTDGIMWFATRNGISTFDGLRWHTFPEKLITPNSDRVNFLPTPEGGMLLTCVASKSLQFYYFDKKDWNTIPSPITLQKDEKLPYTRLVSYYYEAENEYHISFTYKNQLYLYQSNDSLWESFPIPGSIEPNQIRSLHFYSGEIYLFSAKGLVSFKLKTKKFDLQPIPALKDKSIFTAASSADGDTLFILGHNFLGRFSRNQYKTLAQGFFEPNPIPMDLFNTLSNSNGRLVFNYNSALFMLRPESQKVENFKINDGQSNAIPTDIFEDKEGNTWFSTLRGVHKINSFRFHTYNKSSGLLSTDISTILPLNSGKVLLGGDFGISVVCEAWNVPHTADFYSNNASLNRILDAVENPAGETFIAANALGVGVLAPGKPLQWYPHPKGHFITSVAYQNDSLLASTHLGQLLYFNEGQFETLWAKKDLYIRKILMEGNERILLTSEGIFKFSGKKIIRIRGNNQQTENVYSYLTYTGKTFVGSMDGLCELKNDSIVLIQSPPMRIDRPVFAMLRDTQNRLWAGTDKGVYVFEGGKFTNFNLKHGLSGKEINRHAFRLMPDGKIWIGTDQGISVYNPEDDFRPDIIPKIRITGLRTTGEGSSLDPRLEHKLDYDQNTLEFLFQTITFSLPAALELRYRLDGLEEYWVYSGNHLRNSVRYTNLPAGAYAFRVQARYPDGSWSETAISKPITVLKPFYNEWWFLLLVMGAVCSAGYLAHVFINQRENAKKLEQAIEDKKAEIQESERRFRAIWEANDTGTLLVNQLGSIMMVNPAIGKLLGISADQSVGNLTENLLPHPLFSPRRLAQIHKAKKPVQDQVVIEIAHQAYHLQISISFIEQVKQQDSLMVISCKDISRQMQAEATNARLNQELIRHNSVLLRKEDELANYNHELLQQREELEKALRIVEERNYELDQFVYKTSHDLRAPVASAMGLVNVIKMDPDYSSWPYYVDLIGKSLKKQDNFIRAMLNFSKSTRSQNKAEPIDFRKLIKQCLQELHYISGFTEIKKEIEINGEEEQFYSDRMKLYIILSNILSNSIKYRDPYKASYLHVYISLNDNSVDLLIKDNGIGIDEKYVRHIFNMFYRATERSDGSGLGLYIVKQTVEKLEGTIQVHSEAGAGTSFHVHIPNQYSPFDKDFLMDAQDKPSIS